MTNRYQNALVCLFLILETCGQAETVSILRPGGGKPLYLDVDSSKIVDLQTGRSLKLPPRPLWGCYNVKWNANYSAFAICDIVRTYVVSVPDLKLLGTRESILAGWRARNQIVTVSEIPQKGESGNIDYLLQAGNVRKKLPEFAGRPIGMEDNGRYLLGAIELDKGYKFVLSKISRSLDLQVIASTELKWCDATVGGLIQLGRQHFLIDDAGASTGGAVRRWDISREVIPVQIYGAYSVDSCNMVKVEAYAYCKSINDDSSFDICQISKVGQKVVTINKGEVYALSRDAKSMLCYTLSQSKGCKLKRIVRFRAMKG